MALYIRVHSTWLLWVKIFSFSSDIFDANLISDNTFRIYTLSISDWKHVDGFAYITMAYF